MGSIEHQSQYTKFVQHVNRALTEANLDDYHQARSDGIALLNAPETTPGLTNTTQAMLEQLHWWPEARGDVEAGERVQSSGYPYGYVYVGDSVELAQYIPDHSVDLIYTDPPYIKGQMYTYGWVAQEANRVLKDNGFLMTYVGNYWKDNAMAQMREHMSYFWDYTITHEGDLPLQRNRMTRAGHKSVLCYRKPDSNVMPRIEVQDLIQGGGASKEFHPWGQSVDEAHYFISAFSKPNDVVWDPFMGGGTTAVACAQSNRTWFGFERAPEYARIAQDRVRSVLGADN